MMATEQDRKIPAESGYFTYWERKRIKQPQFDPLAVLHEPDIISRGEMGVAFPDSMVPILTPPCINTSLFDA